MIQYRILLLILFFSVRNVAGQLIWENVDSLFQPLPSSVHVYRTESLIDGAPNIAYYVEADLRDKRLHFSTDTTAHRRLTPSQFYQKNRQPIVVVNSTFFSFSTHQNLNLVMRNGKLLAHNIHSIAGKGKDSLTYSHPLGGALGISKRRKADVAWVYTDSASGNAFARDRVFKPVRDSIPTFGVREGKRLFSQMNGSEEAGKQRLKKWKMQTATGGGPVLLQSGEVKISNNEEMKFAGKAIQDKHPRTAMGYTPDHKLIILVIQGRFPGIAEGATLIQEAQILRDLGCVEAINLDGGGSSCLLVNGKETIRPSDKEGQRPVPGVFLIESKGRH